LVGETLVENEYQRLELTTVPDGVLKGYSPMLDLYLCWHEGIPYLYDPAAGQYLRNFNDTQAALREEQAALQEAQARIRQLEEELRRRQ
jgi:hypothetical protein